MKPIRFCITLFFVVTSFGLASCGPLEPLSNDLAEIGVTGVGTRVGTPTSVIKSDTWNLAFVSRLQVPFGDIDPIYLDGKVPESINFEMEGSTLVRHRVLDWGQLQLKDNGFFRFILQYSRYAVRPGLDVGPTATCSADLRGLYSLREGTIMLYPDRFPDKKFSLQLDSEGSLRGIEMPTTCTGQDGGAPFQSDILLRNLVLQAVR